jgi:hypothetical protein
MKLSTSFKTSLEEDLEQERMDSNAKDADMIIDVE